VVAVRDLTYTHSENYSRLRASARLSQASAQEPAEAEMNDLEIIESAEVPDWPLVFVVGSFDSRTTFFSQQTRALNLASALAATGRLVGKWKFCVVGAGAAGLSLAAGLALLLPEAQIHIFEREENALYLQHGCHQRNLHPHIYEWPRAGATGRSADLPILDWTAGSADAVAHEVFQQFEFIRAVRTTAPRRAPHGHRFRAKRRWLPRHL
jgi:hypothetical protein